MALTLVIPPIMVPKMNEVIPPKDQRPPLNLDGGSVPENVVFKSSVQPIAGMLC